QRLVEGMPHEAEVLEYARRTAARSTVERQDKEKDGVFTGRYATNPVNDERIPIWIADYVLMEYGTGAIMAVPAHDARDHEFAEAYDLPIVPVLDDDGKLVNSAQFNGLPWREGITAITSWLSERGRGKPAINYHLRDWSFSRQRYWGCPIPIVYCDEHGAVPVPESELPVLLPEVDDYQPKGEAPLAQATEGINVACPICGKPGGREAATMDSFVGCAWYFL